MSPTKAIADTDLTGMASVENDVTRRPSHGGRRKRLGVWAVVFAVILGGALWYGFVRSPSISADATVSACTHALTNDGSSSVADLVPTVVGLESSVGVAAFETTRGWRWCFAGMGTGTGTIERVALIKPMSAPIAVLDGGFGRDVLMLIHHDRQTTSVVVDTAWSRSVVLASANGFEVLRVPMASWPHWHTPWSRIPVPLGQILGFDRAGQLTSSMPFTWCPGSIDVNPGRGC